MTGSEIHDNPLHAQYYADGARQFAVELIDNLPLARDTYRARLACPDIAARIVPGQFLMLRLAGVNDPLIGRPLAVYDTLVDASGNRIGLEVVYLVKGKFTSRLADCRPGGKLQIWGPLGNGFAPRPCDALVLVAGGIGQTPFSALGREALGGRTYGVPPRASGWARRAILCYGARSAEYLAGVEEFQQTGIDVRVATDDGSCGHRGLVTDLLRQVLDESLGTVQVACCGPEPMMEAVAKIALERHVPCQLSLETPMACGIGICFTCVAKVKDESGGWDYQRTCVEGPVFEASSIDW